MKSPTIDFSRIREHHGSQNTGFEELVYQLIPSIAGVGLSEVVRHGTPDGGIEASIESDDGSVWGWQAKYFLSIGDSQLAQMKRSFESALQSNPTLARYTFVLPCNPPRGKPKRGKSASEKLNDAFVRWASAADHQGRSVEIELVDESRLLDVLMSEGHAGRVLYWFDQRLLFSDAWLKEHVDAAVASAGARYTPSLSIEVPVKSAFDGLGRTPVFDERLGHAVGDIRHAARYLQSTRNHSLPKRLRSHTEQAAQKIASLTTSLGSTSVDGVRPVDWHAYVEKIDEADRCASVVERMCSRSIRRRRSRGTDGDAQGHWAARAESVRNSASWVQVALHGLRALLMSDAARLVEQPLLFLAGDAGTGKTHLLCDMARQRLSEGRPTVLVLGEKLDKGNPRELLPRHLDLPDLTMPELLMALNAAGEAAGTRALLLIDAINEGGGLETWPAHIRAFANEVSRYSHLGLVVSCRTSYVQPILTSEPEGAQPEDLGFISAEHLGFAGHEWDASRQFFEYYELAAPDFPLLQPEYSNPLFLKLLCQSLRSAGETSLPRGSTGITSLFERFLHEANHRLAVPDRCNYRKEDNLVSQAVRKLARAMLEEDEDWIPYSKFRAICKELLPDRDWDRSLEKGLLDEGVVARNWLGADEYLGLSYQRLSDHLQASALLEECDLAGIRAFLSELEGKAPGLFRKSGLLEALAVQLPEKLKCELPDLVTEHDHYVVRRSVLQSIIWRDPAAFSDSLDDYINSLPWGRALYDNPLIETLLHVSCVPGHPYNAIRLDRALRRLSLPGRDAWWTTHINTAMKDDSIAYRIIDWVQSPQAGVIAHDAARLVAITLTWLLASSNRSLRDSATKALVVLLRDRLPLLIDLLAQFEAVDDPYIAERLYCAAYGCALSTRDERALETLAEVVFGRVFSNGYPPVDILLRDHARGIIEIAVTREVLPTHVDLDLVRPPYNSPWPVRPPTQAWLERRAPVETHRSLHASLADRIGDFARYTVGSAVGHFEAPNQRARRKQRRDQARKAAEEAHLQLASRVAGDERALRADAPDDPDSLAAFLAALAREHSQSRRSAGRTDAPVMWSGDEASHWIFRRVLDLGWTPERFSEYDEAMRSDGRHHESNRTERIGKKYQWIALHELLARIADHCHHMPWSGADPEPYEGPWQLRLRDVDPSITFEPRSQSYGQSAVTWWQPLDIPIGPFDGTAERAEWATTQTDLPTDAELARLLRPENTDREPWLTLEGAYNWEEQLAPHLRSPSASKAVLWLQVRSYAIPRRYFADFEAWAKRQDWFGRWMPEGSDLSQVYLGEWPWHPAAHVYDAEWLEIDARGQDIEAAPAEIMPTSAWYHWERDGSLPDGAGGFIPAGWLVRRDGMRWRPGAFTFELRDQQAAADDPAGRHLGPRALLYHEHALRERLDRDGMSIIWTFLGEKNIHGERERPQQLLSVTGVGTLESGHADLTMEARTVLHHLR